MSDGTGEFINAAMKFISHNSLSTAARGIEIITPAIAAHLVENEGKINQNFLEQTIKGALYSLVCGDLLTGTSDEAVILEKSKKYVGYIMNDPQLKELLETNLVSKGIKQGAEYVMNKDTVNAIESLYNELTPKFVEIIKTTRSL